MARVDCQHRLEMMGESAIPLSFQCYLGLTPEEEARFSRRASLGPTTLRIETAAVVAGLALIGSSALPETPPTLSGPGRSALLGGVPALAAIGFAAGYWAGTQADDERKRQVEEAVDKIRGNPHKDGQRPQPVGKRGNVRDF